MDTSGAGSTPFKKQKGDKNRKENGSASAKKDKPKDNKVIQSSPFPWIPTEWGVPSVARF